MPESVFPRTCCATTLLTVCALVNPAPVSSQTAAAPALEEYQEQIGTALEKAQFQGLLELTEDAVRAYPEDPWLRATVGDVALELMYLERARDAYVAALDYWREDSSVRASLAQLHALRGDLDKAVHQLTLAAAEYPDDESIPDLLADLNEYRQALAVVESSRQPPLSAGSPQAFVHSFIELAAESPAKAARLVAPSTLEKLFGDSRTDDFPDEFASELGERPFRVDNSHTEREDGSLAVALRWKAGSVPEEDADLVRELLQSGAADHLLGEREAAVLSSLSGEERTGYINRFLEHQGGDLREATVLVRRTPGGFQIVDAELDGVSFADSFGGMLSEVGAMVEAESTAVAEFDGDKERRRRLAGKVRLLIWVVLLGAGIAIGMRIRNNQR